MYSSKGWEFSIESMTLIPKRLVSPALRSFAESVQMKPKHRLKNDERFAIWNQTPHLPLLDHHLQKVYSFGIQKTGYRAELTATWYPGQSNPFWDLAVRHSDHGPPGGPGVPCSVCIVRG